MVSAHPQDKPGAVPASDRVTEPLPPPPPPSSGPPARGRLTRSRGDRLLGGVAGGLGRYFAVDPVMFRIGFVVATLVGGAGVLAYLAAWLVVPDEDAAPGEATSTRPLAIAGAVVLGVAALAIVGPALPFVAPGLLLVGILAVVVVLVARGSGEHPTTGQVVRRAAILAGVLLLALAGGIAVAVGAAIGGGPVLAGLVIALGLALVGAGLAGRGRWLVVPALVVAIPLALVAAADVEVDASIGEREHRPASVAELRDRYELGVGELTVDLRDVAFPAGTTTVALELGVGQANVIVPEDVCVDAALQIEAGDADVLGRESSGSDVDVAWRQRDEAGGTPRVLIEGDLGLGAIEVEREGAIDFDDDSGDRGPFRNAVPSLGDDRCGTVA